LKLVNIGFGNMVCIDRVIAIVVPESAPIKRIVQESKDRGLCIDATYGRKTRTVLITDTDHVILSALKPEALRRRLDAIETGTDPSAASDDADTEDDFGTEN
jgi:hypothetical protein